MQKNSASEQPKDWHRADVIAALRRSGWTLRKLSLHYKLHERTLYSALDKSYPRGERIIAGALGLKPSDIWPERVAKRNFRPVLLEHIKD